MGEIADAIVNGDMCECGVWLESGDPYVIIQETMGRVVGITHTGLGSDDAGFPRSCVRCWRAYADANTSAITVHDLKTSNPYFDAVWHGAKTFELRVDDRAYGMDDYLMLWEHGPDGYSGSWVFARVPYLYFMDALAAECKTQRMVIMSVQRLDKSPRSVIKPTPMMVRLMDQVRREIHTLDNVPGIRNRP